MKLIYITLFTVLLFSCKQNPLKEVITEQQVKTTETDNTSSAAIYSQLQGTWVNIQSPASTLTFQGKVVVNSFDGIAVKKNLGFSLQDSCTGTNFKNTPIEKNKYIVTTSATPECYYIVRLDKENLILGFWGIEEPLKFKKKTEDL
ncbi:MAG TPA: hypothetical protein DCL52_03880 [Flavobacteriaceae bacterium]|nr:hypothetical protein [Ulvibacter sp.]HAH33907.1 hypothetical protein [Flavobacteriaceae bacterium]|tara:strand:- start:6203 stop:6640 length:438 start_codon:yes stop_codon:yes gene_type:complete